VWLTREFLAPTCNNRHMRGRRPGLLPIERALLEVAVRFESEGSPEFHGFRAAQSLTEWGFQSRLAATGTIYTALDRLRRGGLMESRWEEIALSEAEGRPRRRLYRITQTGRLALQNAVRDEQAATPATKLAGAER